MPPIHPKLERKIKKNHASTLNAGTDGLLIYEVSLKPNSWRIMVLGTPYRCQMKKKYMATAGGFNPGL